MVVYVIQNEHNGKIYIGQTADIEKRLERHNGGLKNKSSSFTSRNKGKWKLVYSERVDSRKDALIRERQLKTAKGRAFVKNLLK